MHRTVDPEMLDHLAPGDPAARRSRRDLLRIHHVMGTRSIVARGWQSLCPGREAATPLRVLDIGAGDGSLLLGVAARLAPRWPGVHLTLMDRQDIVTPATLAAFEAVGWRATTEVADVLDWAAAPLAATHNGAAPRPWDLISTALFLHHFRQAELVALLAAVAARTTRFFACEPRRSRMALAASHLVGAIGANAVTRQDAVLSVHAGFRHQEVSASWPGAAAQWQCTEYAAGAFSHCFSARLAGGPGSPDP